MPTDPIELHPEAAETVRRAMASVAPTPETKIGHTRDECRADQNHQCTLCGLPVPSAGFIVILRGDDGKLSDDWDARVHETREDAEIELAEAVSAGYDAFLTAVVPLAEAAR
jgi:hypothetical protein